jgi:nucleoside-diphosphate-sugar epimerase
MARVLVTGATGFVGWMLPSLLLGRGHDVHVLCRFPDRITWPDEIRHACMIHVGDLCADGVASQIVQAARPTHIIHLAWYAQPGKFWSSYLNLDCVVASLKLFMAFANNGGQRFIGCGTCAEYDWSCEVLSEISTPLIPATLYGTAKASLFQLLTAAAQQGGPAFAWGRLFFPYGPRESVGRLLPDVIAGLLSGREVVVSEGQQVRDFIYVDDAARAFAALVDSTLIGPVNIASGIGISVRTIVETTAALVGRPELVRYGMRMAQPGEPTHMVADARLLREQLVCPAIVGLEDGLGRTVAWWRDYIAAKGERL